MISREWKRGTKRLTFALSYLSLSMHWFKLIWTLGPDSIDFFFFLSGQVGRLLPGHITWPGAVPKDLVLCSALCLVQK